MNGTCESGDPSTRPYPSIPLGGRRRARRARPRRSAVSIPERPIRTAQSRLTSSPMVLHGESEKSPNVRIFQQPTSPALYLYILLKTITVLDHYTSLNLENPSGSKSTGRDSLIKTRSSGPDGSTRGRAGTDARRPGARARRDRGTSRGCFEAWRRARRNAGRSVRGCVR